MFQLDEFKDKQFEEEFKHLVDRLNSNFIMQNRSDLIISNIEEELQKYRSSSKLQSPFKSSHLSYIQSILSHRNQYAQRLKHFD
jgi:hypothetical protein